MTTERPGERPLTGGNVHQAVVRVGDTVRRAASHQSATIQRLLRHVRDQGVAWVPRVFGFDDLGREVLEFLPGIVVHDQPAWLWDEAILLAAARAAREWHDATTTFQRLSGDVWSLPEGRVPHEVIAHNDFAPYNHVFRDGRWTGAIDFDSCYPAPRLWDLAWTAYRYVPLTPPGEETLDDGPGADRSPWTTAEALVRLTVFLEAYGPVARPGEAGSPEPYGASALVAWLPERLDAIADWGERQGGADHRRWARMYRAHARWVEAGGLTVDRGSVAP